jgi:hypothetical protein
MWHGQARTFFIDRGEQLEVLLVLWRQHQQWHDGGVECEGVECEMSQGQGQGQGRPITSPRLHCTISDSIHQSSPRDSQLIEVLRWVSHVHAAAARVGEGVVDESGQLEERLLMRVVRWPTTWREV